MASLTFLDINGRKWYSKTGKEGKNIDIAYMHGSNDGMLRILILPMDTLTHQVALWLK